MKKTKNSTTISAILSSAFTLSCLACSATPASAVHPVRNHYSLGGESFPVENLCGFEVTQTYLVLEIDETIHFDRDGKISKIYYHVVEQDAFAANGKTLIGEPYSASIVAYYNGGQVTNVVAQGVFERVLLPDGSLFIAAGRVDPFTGNVLDSDQGAFVNLDAFCTALAP